MKLISIGFVLLALLQFCNSCSFDKERNNKLNIEDTFYRYRIGPATIPDEEIKKVYDHKLKSLTQSNLEDEIYTKSKKFDYFIDFTKEKLRIKVYKTKRGKQSFYFYELPTKRLICIHAMYGIDDECLFFNQDEELKSTLLKLIKHPDFMFNKLTKTIEFDSLK